MVNLEDNRVLFLDVDGNWDCYSKNRHKSFKDCIEDYTKKKHIVISKKEFVIDRGNVIIYNLGNKHLDIYMPRSLTDEQAYQLDVFQTFSLDDIEYANVKKYNSTGIETFELVGDVGKQFSSKVIQSYYEKHKEKGKVKNDINK